MVTMVNWNRNWNRNDVWMVVTVAILFTRLDDDCVSLVLVARVDHPQ